MASYLYALRSFTFHIVAAIFYLFYVNTAHFSINWLEYKANRKLNTSVYCSGFTKTEFIKIKNTFFILHEIVRIYRQYRTNLMCFHVTYKQKLYDTQTRNIIRLFIRPNAIISWEIEILSWYVNFQLPSKTNLHYLICKSRQILPRWFLSIWVSGLRMYKVNIEYYISNICTGTKITQLNPNHFSFLQSIGLYQMTQIHLLVFNNFSGLIGGSMYLCPQAIGNAVRDLWIW